MTEAYQRKLNPIYDALDSRNWKTATKLCTAALQKYRDDQLLRAIKSWALLMAGRREEAALTCESLLKELVIDDNVLHIMSQVMRSLGRGNELLAMHEAASAAHPKDIKRLRALFAAYARDFNFTKQQQVALKLQRLDGQSEGQYAWWTIVSLVIQADSSAAGAPTSMSASQLLHLAQSMAQKRFADHGSQEGFEALMLYLHILKAEGKHQEALDIVKGDLGQAIQMEEERIVLQHDLMVELGQLEDARELAKGLWTANPDNWKALQMYLDSVMPPTSSPASDRQQIKQAADGTFEAAATIQQVLAALERDAGEAASVPRGAALAVVELEQRRHMLSSAGGAPSTSEPNGDGQSDGGQRLAEAILRCYRQTGHTMSCALDLRAYASALGMEKRRWLVDHIKRSLPHSSGEESTMLSLSELRRLVAAYQIESDLGLPAFADGDAAAAHAQELMSMYAASQHLSSGLDERERGPADELPALAVTALVAAWKLDPARGPTHLLRALLLLEAAQVRRKVSAGMQLAAAFLYSLLGAPLLAQQQLKLLELKYIQHDSLSGHLLLPALLSGLCADEVPKLLAACTDLYANHLNSCGDSLTLTYEHNNYTKALEFIAFKKRLELSFSRFSALAEGAIYSIFKQAHTGLAEATSVAIGHVEELRRLPSVWSDSVAATLRFNVDLTTRPCWYPPSAAGPSLALADWWQEVAQSVPAGIGDCWWHGMSAEEAGDPHAAAYRQLSLQHLKRRMLLPELLVGMLQLQDPAAELGSAFSEAFSRMLLLEGIAEGGGLDEWLERLPASIAGLPLTEICRHLDVALFATVQATQEPEDDRCCSRCKELCSSVRASSTRITDDLASGHTRAGLPVFGPAWVMVASFLHETLTWAALWLQVSRTRQAAANKKGRKGKTPEAAAKRQPGRAEMQASASKNGSTSTGCQLPEAAIVQLQKAITGVCKSLQEACGSEADAKRAAVGLEQELLSGGSLWNWEPSVAAASVLQRLVEDQQELLTRLRVTGAKVSAMCKSVT